MNADFLLLPRDPQGTSTASARSEQEKLLVALRRLLLTLSFGFRDIAIRKPPKTQNGANPGASNIVLLLPGGQPRACSRLVRMFFCQKERLAADPYDSGFSKIEF